MKLVIGGAYQGKTAYACEVFGLRQEQAANGRTSSLAEVYEAGLIVNFHEYIRRLMESGTDVTNLAEEIIRRNPSAVIVSNELGYGVVPMDAFDRAYREAAGRICCKLAAASDEVHRVVCGIGMVIKGA